MISDLAVWPSHLPSLREDLSTAEDAKLLVLYVRPPYLALILLTLSYKDHLPIIQPSVIRQPIPPPHGHDETGINPRTFFSQVSRQSQSCSLNECLLLLTSRSYRQMPGAGRRAVTGSCRLLPRRLNFSFATSQRCHRF